MSGGSPSEACQSSGPQSLLRMIGSRQQPLACRAQPSSLWFVHRALQSVDANLPESRSHESRVW